ncbi:tyrosine-type recombinase/integrase [Halorubrum sp. JWXQ-INN 858]|uniref:tyrosine-type recombinase/integrase n=1 Tax=Halorubrum sp. JWXQ-INN 858 TaxID=2690782 RepID=UPI0013F82E94|nr:site-specific integrase [Halorubrum sp. JWXQ-INN 858]MWV64274.1 tyrosine-type recombinase/integrase [Halorubrum sp. JWXQ-INN 858]
MSDDLQPISPRDARELYLEALRDEAAEWTISSHRSHLRAFIEWCEEEAEIENMNELTGRDVYQFRLWRRGGGYSKGKDGEIAPRTLNSALNVVRVFLRFCGRIEAVLPDLYERVDLPALSKDDQVSDSTIDPDRVPEILTYLTTYEYASRDHAIWALVWHTGVRLGGVRALDLDDVHLEGGTPYIELIHRPGTGTPLKNKSGGERTNRISDRVAKILQDYIDGPRVENLDDHGRSPLMTTREGRISHNAVRMTFYRWTRTCAIGKECPHDEDPETCEFVKSAKMSQCPSTRSPHDVRKARVTRYRNDNVPRAIVSDRLNASEDVLDLHYDRASDLEKANRRWEFLE